jgi:hypothetical protein
MKILATLLLMLPVALVPLAHSDESDTINFRFHPIGIIVGALGVNLDFKIHDHWTLGPALSYWQLRSGSSGALRSDLKLEAYSVGARANWFMNGAYTDGLYVGPSLNLVGARAEATDVDGTTRTASLTIVAAQGLVGYGWFWKSFNQMLGAGLGIGLGETQLEVKDSTGRKSETKPVGAGFALEYSLGWTF